MDKHWIPPNANNKEIHEILKRKREDERNRKLREERYRNGDYSN